MAEKQLLHMVFGGTVTDPQKLTFENCDELDIVGIFPNYAKAEAAWRTASQANVDDAMKRYVIVHMHRLIDPDSYNH